MTASDIKRWHRWLRHVPATPFSTELQSLLTKAQAYTLSAEHYQPGDDLILVGKIGLAGTYLLSKYKKAAFKPWLPEGFIEAAQQLEPDCHRYLSVDMLTDLGVSGVFAVAEGGLYRSLYELGKASGLGYRIDYPEIGVHQTTIEFCEVLDMDPLKLLSCGCQLLIAPRQSYALRKLLQTGITDCALIGQLTHTREKVLVHKTFESLVNRPDPDALLSYLTSSSES